MKLKSLLLATAIIGSSILTIAPEAQARCKVKGPMGTWTYVPCGPHNHTRFGSGGNRTTNRSKYYFKVINVDTTDTISYWYGGTRYRLRPGYERKHTKVGSKNVYLYMDRIAGNGQLDRYNWNFNADLYDLKIWRKGKFLRVREVPD